MKHRPVAFFKCPDWGQSPQPRHKLTGNQASDPSVCGMTPNRLSRTDQGCSKSFMDFKKSVLCGGICSLFSFRRVYKDMCFTLKYIILYFFYKFLNLLRISVFLDKTGIPKLPSEFFLFFLHFYCLKFYIQLADLKIFSPSVLNVLPFAILCLLVDF